MSSYLTSAGDTYSSISGAFYGDASGASRIRQANPSADNPPVPGTLLIIPERLRPQKNSQRADIPGDEVTLRVAEEQFRYWTQVSITRSVDAVDTIHLLAPFPESVEFRRMMEPLSYRPIEVQVGGETLFFGTMLSVKPQSNAGTTVEVSGYSTCGVLVDCTPLPSMAPLNYLDRTLPQIAAELAEPYGVGTVSQVAGGFPAIERFRIAPDQKIVEALTPLAKQQSVLISSNPEGELLFRDSPSPGPPVVFLDQGSPPLIRADLSTDPQAYFSDVTGVRKARRNFRGGKYTVQNDTLRSYGVLRHVTQVVEDVSSGELPAATQSRVGRMLAASVTVTAQVATWRDATGSLWEPGSTVSLVYPDAMVYSPYEFILDQVTFEANPEKSTASLSLVLPGAYSGSMPEEMPWHVR